MSNNMQAYMAIILMASIILMIRVSGAEFMSILGITPRIETFLEAMSGSVIVAIVVSQVVNGGPRTLVAIMLTAVIMKVSKSSMLAMLCGIGCAAVWTFLAS